MNKSREGYQYEEEQDELTTFANLLLVVNFALGLAAIAANAFVIDTIKSRSELAVSGDMFVLCLAITDLLTGCILTLTVGNIFVEKHTKTMCLLQICSLQSTLLCSAFILSALTTDRYLKIVHPFKHERICNDWQPHWVCCSLAVSSCIIGFLPFTGTGHTADANFMMCSYLQVLEAGFQAALFVLMVASVFLSVVLYFWILRLAMNHAVAIARTTRFLSENINRIQLRYIRVLFVMAGMYLALYIPAVVGTILLRNIHTTMKETTRSSLFHLCSIGMWSNCLINPLIYASKVATVKARLRLLFGWRRLSADQELPSRKTVTSIASKGILERTLRYCTKLMSVKVTASNTGGQTDDDTRYPSHDSAWRDSRVEGSGQPGDISTSVRIKSKGVNQSGRDVGVSGEGSENSGVRVIRPEDSSVKVTRTDDNGEDGSRSQDSAHVRSNKSFTNRKQVK